MRYQGGPIHFSLSSNKNQTQLHRNGSTNVRYASACRDVREIQLTSEFTATEPHDKLKHIGHLLSHSCELVSRQSAFIPRASSCYCQVQEYVID